MSLWDCNFCREGGYVGKMERSGSQAVFEVRLLRTTLVRLPALRITSKRLRDSIEAYETFRSGLTHSVNPSVCPRKLRTTNSLGVLLSSIQHILHVIFPLSRRRKKIR